MSKKPFTNCARCRQEKLKKAADDEIKAFMESDGEGILQLVSSNKNPHTSTSSTTTSRPTAKTAVA